MVKQVLFVQGAGEGVHDGWDSKLVANLERELGVGYALRYPRMPGEDDPAYPAWKAELLKQIGSLEDGAMLVGHSVGGAILIRLLAEQPVKLAIGGLFIIAAPFIGNGGWPGDDGKNVAERLPPGFPVFLYHGEDDDIVPIQHADLYALAIPRAVVRRLKARDHQLNNDMSDVAQDIRSAG